MKPARFMIYKGLSKDTLYLYVVKGNQLSKPSCLASPKIIEVEKLLREVEIRCQ